MLPVAQYIGRHLQRYHSHISPRVREQIVTVVTTIEGVASQPADGVNPDPSKRAIPGLPMYENILWCTAAEPDDERCSHVVRNVQKMQEHCKKAHG